MEDTRQMQYLEVLRTRSEWVRTETLRLHKLAPESRLASSLSAVEIFVVLYYGHILEYNSQNFQGESRDRLIVSKGHGAVCLYPILADLKFFGLEELGKINSKDSLLTVIPDSRIPGFETTNGALGHGLGVACGIALGMRRKGLNQSVFVVSGDGELNEGAVWEAVMFASYHRLDNLILIVDNNKMSMLGYQKDILGLEPLETKFAAFGWKVETANGHDVRQLYATLGSLKRNTNGRPKVLIADTCKGKGVPALEGDPLCHVRSLRPDEIDDMLEEWK